MKKTEQANRNVRCKKCGQKLKNCKCRSRSKKLLVIIYSIIGLLVVVLIYFSFQPKKKDIYIPPINITEKYSSDRLKDRRLRGVTNKYLSNRNKESWWLKTEQITDFETEIKQLIEKEELIKNILSKFKSTSPLAEQISDNFKVFGISTYISRGRTSSGVISDFSRRIIIGDVDNSAEAIKKTDIELCFIPQNQSSRLKYDLYYRADWKALMMPGINYPEALFSAFLYHELGHALRHLVDKAPSAVAPQNSDLYISEEIEMHTLEGDILNKATNGRFYEYINDYIDSKTNVNDYKNLITNVQVENLLKLDEIIGCSDCGSAIANHICAQYLMSIGLLYIDREGGSLQQKIALYRWLR